MILIVLLLLSLYARSLERNVAESISQPVNQLEGLKSTRIILDWEFDDGEKVYQRLIRACNNEDVEDGYVLSSFAEDLSLILNLKSPPHQQLEFVFFVNQEVCLNSMPQKYLFIKNQKYWFINMPGSRQSIRKSAESIPKTFVPNPQGDPLLVLIKEIKKADREYGT